MPMLHLRLSYGDHCLVASGRFDGCKGRAGWCKDQLHRAVKMKSQRKSTVYFITHPDVVIDPAKPVAQWPLSQRGRMRMLKLAEHQWVARVRAIYCSTEQKAIDGAVIISEALAIPYTTIPEFGENDRSATGYL